MGVKSKKYKLVNRISDEKNLYFFFCLFFFYNARLCFNQVQLSTSQTTLMLIARTCILNNQYIISILCKLEKRISNVY